MKTGILLATATIAGIIVGSGALAASPEASKEFNAEVEKGCAEAAKEMFRKPQVAVDPVGSEKFGLAIVYGRSKELKGRAAIICVVDKKTGELELGSPMGNDVLRVRKPKDPAKADKADAADDDDGGQSGDE